MKEPMTEWIKAIYDMASNAIVFATQAHMGQRDKSGDMYILHPLRVALKFRDPYSISVAALHDVMEDCGVTRKQLVKEGFDGVVIEAVETLTHRPNEPYEKYIHRVNQNSIARGVKKQDVLDNLNRVWKLDPKTRARLIKKYTKAMELMHYRLVGNEIKGWEVES